MEEGKRKYPKVEGSQSKSGKLKRPILAEERKTRDLKF